MQTVLRPVCGQGIFEAANGVRYGDLLTGIYVSLSKTQLTSTADRESALLTILTLGGGVATALTSITRENEEFSPEMRTQGMLGSKSLPFLSVAMRSRNVVGDGVDEYFGNSGGESFVTN